MDFIEYGTYTKKIETHHLWIGLVGWSDLHRTTKGLLHLGLFSKAIFK